MGATLTRTHRRGTGLVENLVALVVLGIGAAAFQTMLLGSCTRVSQDALRMRMQTLCANTLEVLRCRPQSELEQVLLPVQDRVEPDFHRTLAATYPEYQLDQGPFDGPWGTARVSCQATRSEPVAGALIGLVVEVTWVTSRGGRGSFRLARLVRRVP